MEIFGKTAVFRADMAGLGKYHTGGYGRIGVYRVKGSSFGFVKFYRNCHVTRFQWKPRE